MIIAERKDKKDGKGKNNVILDDTPSLKSHFNCSIDDLVRLGTRKMKSFA